MTLEVLFAQAGQTHTFLEMLLLGAVTAMAIHGCGALHRLHRGLGMAADVLCACGMAAGCGQILLHSGEGLRLYGLLGLLIGATLYAWGIAPLFTWLGHSLIHVQKEG